MAKPPEDQKTVDAVERLERLNLQTDLVSKRLTELRQELAEVQLEFGKLRGAQLLEANEHLVLAALQAGQVADTVEPQLQDLREANAQLVIAAISAQELEARAENAHRQQVRFLAMVAHELRNPLTPIRTVALLLNHARVDKPQLARLQSIIDRQVTHISRLIDDLLDGSRVSAGKFKLECRVVMMADVLETAVQMSKPAMEKRQQRLVETNPASVIQVYGDAMRLTQVFSNLLDNASKYTPHGGDIHLTMVLVGDGVVVTVADNGIGISAHALLHIFDLFVQGATAAAFAQSSHGLGIGLAVVRDLVEAHGGSVSATSKGPNLGSEFVVNLPRDAKPRLSFE